MSSAITTQGITIQRGDGAGTEVFSTIAEIQSFTGPGGSAQVIDVTSVDSSAKEKRMGLPDEGQFSFECILVPGDTAQDGLRDDRDNQTERNFKIVMPDTASTTLAFAAYVTAFSVGGGVDDVIKASITLEITGAVTWS